MNYPKLHTFCLFSLLCILSGWVAFAAVTGSEAGKILKNFKQLEKEMIFESDTILLSEEDKWILSSYKRLWVLWWIGDKIQSKREYLENQNKKIISRWQSLEKTIKAMDEDIAELVLEVNNINSNIISTKDKIKSNKQTIGILKKRITQNTQTLLKYLEYLYKKWEYVKSGETNDIDNLKTILLSGQNIDAVLSDLYFKSLIQVTGQKLIAKHRSFISQLYKKQIELKKDEEDLKVLRKKGVLEKSILDDKRAAKKRLLDATKGQEKLYKKYISEKLAVERDVKVKELRERIRLNNTKKNLLNTHGCEFVDVSSAEEIELSELSEKCLWINKIIYAESRLTWVPSGNNPFSWPVEPFLWISAFFRDQGYKDEFDTDHDAIDIIIPQGTDIKAPTDGYVIYIQPPINNGYAYVALKHSDSLVSLYGHVNEVLVEKNDFVKRGEVFAKTGGEYGTKWAGILTTGPHLHFVVYKDKEYVDPLEYLNLSHIRFQNIPDRYKYKYYSDFKSRRGYDFAWKKDSKWRFRIEGDTEIERQKYLLNTYAVGAFRDWNLWVEESVSEGIDPSFVMCVWLAETTLGKYLKTSYNIGNVGNTDSGSTYSFSSAREGIHWMTVTFNNKYLSQYDEIRQLSRYGNKDTSKPIYASSDFNWHNNIIKCMSHIKWHFIPDNYSFRLSKQ